MQSPAEKHLVGRLRDFVAAGDAPASLLNIGAGRSTAIEEQLNEMGVRYRCDRTDVEDCSVAFPSVGEAWTCPVEDMHPVANNGYDAAFANYVLEHVADVGAAAREIGRVLRPGGIFLATLPNPRAPEFVISRHTPLWLHGRVRRDEAWETHYAYRRIETLVRIFATAGFSLQDEACWSWVEGYLHRYPLGGAIGRLYDRLVTASGARRLMGQVCLTFLRD